MRQVAVVVALLCVAFAVAQDVEVPQGILDTYDEFYGAIEVGDIDTAQGYMHEIAVMQAKLSGMGRQGDVMRLGDTYEIESLTPVFLSCAVEGERAVVEYDLAIKGVLKETGEEKEEVWRHVDGLRGDAAGWQIMAASRADPEREAQAIKDGALKDDVAGIACPIPEGWVAHVIWGMAGTMFTITAPDLETAVVVLVVDLPVSLTAQALAEAEHAAMDAFGITAELESKGETTLDGKPAYYTAGRTEISDIIVQSRHIYCVDSSETHDVLYALVMASSAENGMEDYKAELAKIESGLRITERQEQELPPELGKIVDGKYLNATHEVTMDIAKGWKPRLSESRFLFQLIVVAPEGKSTLLLGAVDVGQWIPPKAALQGDLQMLRQQSPDLEIIEEGELASGAVEGYQCLTEFALGDGEPRRRWQVMFMRDTVLFFAVGEAVPAADYEKVKDDWKAMVDSLKFGPVEE